MMAAGHTRNIREHIMGDMHMLVGTFTDGGTDVYYGDTLSEVFAAGGHVTSLYNTGVLINDATPRDVGYAGALTVDTVDARLHFNIGETLYAGGLRVGVITAIGGATSITCGGGLLGPLADNDELQKLGPNTGAVTLTDGTLTVSVDETNKYVVFGNGNLGAASTAHTGQNGRWWILGKR